jgi:hypothetical protein
VPVVSISAYCKGANDYMPFSIQAQLKLHRITTDHLLTVQVTEEGPDCSRVGLDRLCADFFLFRLVEGVIKELGSLLEGDNEMPEVIAGEIFDFLPIRSEEITEVVDTRGDPPYCLGAFPFCLSTDTISGQSFG